MTNAIANMTNSLTVDADDPKAVKAAVAEALVQMRAAHADEKEGVEHAFKAALTLGAHAATVKGYLGSEFAPWMEKNFGEGTRKPISIQWIYKCINASLAFAALPKSKTDRNAILERWGTIKGLASIRVKLEQDGAEDLLALPAPEKAKRGAPTKAEREAKAKKAERAAAREAAAEEEGEAETAADLKKRESALARKEKALDAKEERLNAFEEELNERERLLAMREAAVGKPSTVLDVEAKGAPDLEAARDAARKPTRAQQRAEKAAAKAKAAAEAADAPASAEPGEEGDEGETVPTTEASEAAAAEEEVL